MITEIKNGKEINFGFDPSSIYDKVAKDYPMCFKFEPAIYLPINDEVIPFEKLYSIYNDSRLIRNATLCLKYTIFPSQDMLNELYKKFSGSRYFMECLKTFVDKLLEYADCPVYQDDIINLDIENITDNIQIDIIKESIDSVIDSMVSSMNKNYDNILKMVKDFYFIIGYNLHKIMIVNDYGITKQFVDKDYLSIFSSRFMTTYLYINGIK